MSDSRDRLFWRVLLNAATKPLNVLLLAGMAAAAILTTPWVLGAAIPVYGLMIASTIRDPEGDRPPRAARRRPPAGRQALARGHHRRPARPGDRGAERGARHHRRAREGARAARGHPGGGRQALRRADRQRAPGVGRRPVPADRRRRRPAAPAGRVRAPGPRVTAVGRRGLGDPGAAAGGRGAGGQAGRRSTRRSRTCRRASAPSARVWCRPARRPPLRPWARPT